MRSLFLTGATALVLTLAACGAPADESPTEAAETAAPGTAETAAAPEAETAAPMTMDEILAGDWRSDAERARDDFRNPAETLAFFGIERDHTVVELWPGGGWYTKILGPYLASGDGTLIAAGFDPEAFEGERRERVEQRVADFTETFAANPELYGNVIVRGFSGLSGPLAEPDSVDAVLTFRNLHNWMAGDYHDKFYADAFAALKPGGVLGVVEHRLPSTVEQDPTASSGYVHEDFVVAAAERAGFELVERSEINANPADTADHPFGVWTLPPNSRTEDRDGNTPEGFDPEIYIAIGESDRMTLKFRKPEA